MLKRLALQNRKTISKTVAVRRPAQTIFAENPSNQVKQTAGT
jgi:hypothetical protein